MTGMFGAQTTGDTSGYGGLVVQTPKYASSPKPYGGYYDEVSDQLERNGFADAIDRVVVDRGEITFHIKRERLVETAQALRDDPMLRFEVCTGVSGVHYPAEKGAELRAVYHLLSMTHNRRIRLEVSAPDADPHIPSKMIPKKSQVSRSCQSLVG